MNHIYELNSPIETEQAQLPFAFLSEGSATLVLALELWLPERDSTTTPGR